MFGFKKRSYEFFICYSYKTKQGFGYGNVFPATSSNKVLSSNDILDFINIISNLEEIKGIIEGKIVITFIKRLRT
jgi:hypothetical protein